MERVALPGSVRPRVANHPHAAVPAPHPGERVEVTVRLRRRQELVSAATMSRESLADRFGSDPDDVMLVDSFADSHGLHVVDVCHARRHVILSGPVEAIEKAFGVKLEHRVCDCQHGCTYRTHEGPITLPESLNDVVVGVLGLDTHPAAKPHFRRSRVRRHYRGFTYRGARPLGSFTPVDLAKLYNFPVGDGEGQTIAIIELGGGYVTKDLHTYFASLGLPTPVVTSVSVDHGRNAPEHNPDGADGEVMLDIEVAGAVAPKAKLVVYFAPNTSQGFVDAVHAAVHDTVNKPSVISISWGGPEDSWDAQSMAQFDEVFQEAATLGVTITVAAGDNGSSDGEDDGSNHVDFPASSPLVIACGGTRVVASAPGTPNEAIQTETVWNDGFNGGATGGGFSTVYAMPTYQQGVATAGQTGSPMRGVPDIAADADPETGYVVRVDGQDTVIGGTSAVAPLVAGLVAILNQALGSNVGDMHSALYAHPEVCRDIVSGNNGSFTAAQGWDACTGLGVIDGAKLLSVLKQPATSA
jgi:kumamolisin